MPKNVKLANSNTLVVARLYSTGQKIRGNAVVQIEDPTPPEVLTKIAQGFLVETDEEPQPNTLSFSEMDTNGPTPLTPPFRMKEKPVSISAAVDPGVVLENASPEEIAAAEAARLAAEEEDEEDEEEEEGENEPLTLETPEDEEEGEEIDLSPSLTEDGEEETEDEPKASKKKRK